MLSLNFHPNTTLVEAASVAASQGCALRARDGRIYMVRAQAHLDSAMRAVDQGKFNAALSSLRSSRNAVERAHE